MRGLRELRLQTRRSRRELGSESLHVNRPISYTLLLVIVSRADPAGQTSFRLSGRGRGKLRFPVKFGVGGLELGLEPDAERGKIDQPPAGEGPEAVFTVVLDAG